MIGKFKVIVGIFAIMTATNAAAESLCSNGEISLFSCQLGKSIKSVSLCQSKADHKAIYYKFGTHQKVELTLPNNKTRKPYIHFEQFGSSSMQWLKSINFTSGKAVYSLSTPQGISASVTVEGIKKPVYLSCDSGDSGPELSNAFDEMENLGFVQK